MSESLTERLQQRLSSRTAEIEALTTAELRKLGAQLRSACSAELSTTHRHIEETTDVLDASLRRLRRFGRFWWVGLVATWLVMGVLSILPFLREEPEEMRRFTDRTGVTYLIPPLGSAASSCTQGEARFLCIRLPEGR